MDHTITLSNKMLSDIRAILIVARLNMEAECREAAPEDLPILQANIRDVAAALEALPAA